MLRRMFLSSVDLMESADRFNSTTHHGSILDSKLIKETKERASKSVPSTIRPWWRVLAGMLACQVQYLTNRPYFKSEVKHVCIYQSAWISTF